MKANSNISTLRQLERRCRLALYRDLVSGWHGTRGALRTAVRIVLRGIMRGAMRRKIAWMMRVVREARFAALVAGTILATALGGSPTSVSAAPIQLSDITAGAGGFAIDGVAAGDKSGWSVSAAGDVNGDGLADVIVGANRTDQFTSDSGRSFVVFGKATGTLVSLFDVAAGIDGFAINGEAYGDVAGLSVSAAGDVNGDGLGDLIVGASGRSYVVFGKTTGTRVQLTDITAGFGGFTINGEAENGLSGRSVSAAVDVNGDGLADLIVGAPSAGPNGSFSGRSYVVFGRAGGEVVQLSDVTVGAGGFAIDGEARNDLSSYSVSGAGDVNGDGLADIIVGAPRADPNGNASGRSYIVFGKATGARVQLSDITGGTGGFAIDGEDLFDYAGRSVSGAGDVNGDGLADIILGVRGVIPSGSSYVIFGKAGGSLIQLSNLRAGTGGFAINGEADGDAFGVSASAAGDVNGDGLADLIIGAHGADPNGDESGRTYVVFGRTSGLPVQLSNVNAGVGGLAMDGEGANDFSGRSVSAAGDVNGDGLADLIVGAHYGNSTGGPDSGRSYVIFSAEVPPRSAVFNAFSRAGDGPGGDPVVPTVVGDSRVTIDWPDDDFGRGMFNIQTSKERIVINRTNALIGNLEPIANVAQVCWGVLTDRPGAGPAEVTFKYLDLEIAGIALGSEADLAIFAADSPDGPWVKLTTTIDSARNTARVTTTLGAFTHFALAEAATAPVAPVNSARQWLEYR